MQISENGIRFIESFEGFAGKVYNDVGHPAIGYGHDLQPGESYPDGITQPEAEALLIQDVNTRYAPVVNGLIPSDCTQNQFDALCSFAYNLGTGSLGTMLAHGWDQVPVQIPRWNKVSGQPNAGLTARRQAEVELFQQGAQ
ncbi:MAG: lysozyme [Terriglobia bacterium]